MVALELGYKGVWDRIHLQFTAIHQQQNYVDSRLSDASCVRYFSALVALFEEIYYQRPPARPCRSITPIFYYR